MSGTESAWHPFHSAPNDFFIRARLRGPRAMRPVLPPCLASCPQRLGPCLVPCARVPALCPSALSPMPPVVCRSASLDARLCPSMPACLVGSFVSLAPACRLPSYVALPLWIPVSFMRPCLVACPPASVTRLPPSLPRFIRAPSPALSRPPWRSSCHLLASMPASSVLRPLHRLLVCPLGNSRY